MACSICRKEGHNKRYHMSENPNKPTILFTEELRGIITEEIFPHLDKDNFKQEFNKVKNWLCEGSGLSQKDKPVSYQDLIGKGSGEAGRMAGIVSYYVTNSANRIISDSIPGWEKSEGDGYDANYTSKDGTKIVMEQKTSLKKAQSSQSKDWTGNGCSKKQGSYFLIQLLIDETQPLNRDGDFIKDVWIGFAPIDGVEVVRGKGKSDIASIFIRPESELITNGLVKYNRTKKSPLF